MFRFLFPGEKYQRVLQHLNLCYDIENDLSNFNYKLNLLFSQEKMAFLVSFHEH